MGAPPYERGRATLSPRLRLVLGSESPESVVVGVGG